jgi:DNA-binding IscR family transcriptional regulator
MNSYKFNGIAGHISRQTIARDLKIPLHHIYKTVKSIDYNGIIETHDGKKYVLELKEVTDEKAI